MTEVEMLLRRLALNDEVSLQSVLVTAEDDEDAGPLIGKMQWLVRLAALLALGAATPSLRGAAAHAHRAGASDAEIAAVLVAVAPVIGQARVVSIAPRLAGALGLNLNGD